MDRIVVYPDSHLRKKIAPCTLPASEISTIVSRLIKVMLREKHGIGIAAPQIGILENIAIVDLSSRDSQYKRMVLINPMILESRNPNIGREGCMSVPDYTALVQRYEWIRFKYMNINGEWIEKVSTGIEAICVQHEIDHLHGKILIDAVSCLKTDLLPRHLRR